MVGLNLNVSYKKFLFCIVIYGIIEILAEKLQKSRDQESLRTAGLQY